MAARSCLLCSLALLAALSVVIWWSSTTQSLCGHDGCVDMTMYEWLNMTIRESLIRSTPIFVESGGASNKTLQKSLVAPVEEGQRAGLELSAEVRQRAGLEPSVEVRQRAGLELSIAAAQKTPEAAPGDAVASAEMELVRRALGGFLKLSKGSSRQESKFVELGGGERIASTESVKTALHKLLVIAFGGQEKHCDELAHLGCVAFRADMLRFASALQTNVDGHLIPAETRAKGCVELMLTMFVAMIAAPMNVVAVEYGTMMGYSTRCLAAGARMALLAGAHAGDESFFAFDVFNYIPKWKPTWKNSSMAGKEAWLLQGDNYRQQVKHNVLPYTATLTKGMLGATVNNSAPMGSPWFWGGRVASFVSIDGGKDRPFWNTVTALFMPSLRIGSLILAGDSMAAHGVMCVQMGTILGALVGGGYVDLVHAADRESFTTWIVLKEVPGNLITNFKFRSLTAGQWDSLWDRFEQQRMEILTQVYGADMNVDADITRLQEARTCCKSAP